MTTVFIVFIVMLGASLPMSRAILNMIKRSDKYSDEYKKKAQMWRNIYRVACIVLAFVLWLMLRSHLGSAN